MKKSIILLTVTALFAVTNVSAKTDKKLLKFWDNLVTTIKAGDNTTLAGLAHFPFNYDGVSLTKDEFITDFMLFSDVIQEISKDKLPKISEVELPGFEKGTVLSAYFIDTYVYVAKVNNKWKLVGSYWDYWYWLDYYM